MKIMNMQKNIERLYFKNLDDDHDLYVETHELNLAHFLSAPGLAWQAYLKDN